MAFIYLASVFYLADSTVTEFNLSSWDHQFGKYFTLTVYKDSHFGWLHCTLSEINGCSSDRYFQLDFHVRQLSLDCNGYLVGWHETWMLNYSTSLVKDWYRFIVLLVQMYTLLYILKPAMSTPYFQSIRLLLSMKNVPYLEIWYSTFEI